MKFSVCMTNYNTADVLQESLESIISRIDPDDFEIVIVDSKSTDGSLEILNGMKEKFPRMSILSKKCLRGEGRQIALENSRGDYVITADADTLYFDVWRKVIDKYVEGEYDFGLSCWFSQIYPRTLLHEVGGWKNLQYMEDVELWCRLASIGKYRTYPIVCGKNLKRNPATNVVEGTVRRFLRTRDKITLFWHIPFWLYLAGYWKVLRERYGGGRLLTRMLYHGSIHGLGTVSAFLRRLKDGYGDVMLLRSVATELTIDLQLVEREELRIPAYTFTTLEECIDAYRKADYGFLPGFYD